jgi:HK97 family phage major capsid protein/HK97 family phage prohead protease
MNRAYTLLEIRAVDDDQRIIEGVASTNAVDDYGTILEPKGARFSLPLPLLWQHRSDTPVGEVFEAKVTAKQIRIRARLAKVIEEGSLKEDTDRAWQAVKYGLVKGLSVGFKPVETAPRDTYDQPIRFVEWILRELSLVTLPANIEATISAVRSADLAHRAASGAAHPGVPGSRTTPNPQNPRGTMPDLTISEQIERRQARSTAALERCNALMATASTEGRDLTDEEQAEYDGLQRTIEATDGDIARLRHLEAQNVRRATPAPATPAAPGQRRTPAESAAAAPQVRVEAPDPAMRGINFARQAMALAACHGNRFEAAEYVRAVFGESAEEVALSLRAAVAAGTTTDATWAAPLVQTNFLNEFLELLRPATLLGRIPGLRRVPFNISMPAQTAGGTYAWVGQGSAKPLTNMAFSSVTLGQAKAAGIIVITKELARSSAPSAQEAVRDELVKGISQFLDGQFVDPAVAAVANVSPASITNGVAGTAASGTAEANARADLRALVATFETNNLGTDGLVLLMKQSTAFTLATMVNAVGGQAFPGLTADGGTLLGIPVITSNTVGARIIAVHAPSILLADDGQTEIDVSEEASLQMDSAPANPTDATTVMVSMFQRNLVALRAERWINWAKARATAVDMITGVAYA